MQESNVVLNWQDSTLPELCVKFLTEIFLTSKKIYIEPSLHTHN